MARAKTFIRIFLFYTLTVQIILSQSMQVEKFNPTKFLSEVQQNYKNFENFVIEFKREVSSPAVTGKQISKGKLYFLNRNKYRLEINGQLIISDGEIVYNYSKKARRVVITKFEENFFSPENLLTNFPQSTKNEFLGEENLNDQKAYKFQFYPSSSNPEFKSMIIWININKVIQKIQVEDWAGNVYLFATLLFNPNQKLKDDLIKFKIQKGVRVVDLR